MATPSRTLLTRTAPAPRRSGSEKRQRSATLALRLTPEERAAVEAAADSAGLSLAGYAHRQLFGGLAHQASGRAPQAVRTLAQLLGELGDCSTQLRTLAQSGFERALSEREHAALAAELDGLKQLRDAVVRALGHNP